MNTKPWIVSNACAIAGCIEVQQDGDFVHIRLTGDRDVVLRATAAEWVAFIAGVKTGQFDFAFSPTPHHAIAQKS
ncbi:MAG: DUF397 domain-containing protein [Patescibacteria group bacterium]